MPKKSKKPRKPSSLIGSTAFRKLYDAALHILTLQPWNYFTSGDCFIQYPKNSERMILACTVNLLTEGFGVLVYPNPALCPDSILLSDVFVISEREYIESLYPTRTLSATLSIVGTFPCSDIPFYHRY